MRTYVAVFQNGHFMRIEAFRLRSAATAYVEGFTHAFRDLGLFANVWEAFLLDALEALAPRIAEDETAKALADVGLREHQYDLGAR